MATIPTVEQSAEITEPLLEQVASDRGGRLRAGREQAVDELTDLPAAELLRTIGRAAPNRGTIRLVPVTAFDVFDGETQIGRIHSDYNEYDGTVRFQALTWTTPATEFGLFPSIPDALGWLQQQVAAQTVHA